MCLVTDFFENISELGTFSILRDTFHSCTRSDELQRHLSCHCAARLDVESAGSQCCLISEIAQTGVFKNR